MNINMRIDTFNIDFHKFTRAMERDCDKLLKLGAQKWLLAVLARIPIRTGFLAGAFTVLEDLVGVAARDEKTGKTTGKIMNSRNPLLTRDKKIQLLKSKLQKLQKDLEVDIDSFNKLKGEIADSRVKRKKLAGDEGGASPQMLEYREKNRERNKNLSFEQKIAQENEHRRELMRRSKRREREIIEDLDKIKAVKRIRKRIEKLERTAAYKRDSKVMNKFLTSTGEEIKGKGGRRPTKLPAGAELNAGMSATEVRMKLDQARKELVKIMGKTRKPYNPKIAKEFITGKIQVRGKTKYLKVRKVGDTHPISRYIAERENQIVQAKQEAKQEKKVNKLLDRMRAKQAELGNTTKVLQETTQRVKTGRFLLKRKESSIGKDILAYNEYYRYIGGKVLKTPRSGTQFVTPKNPNEIFGKFSGAERTQFEQQLNVVSTAKSQVDAFMRFRAEFEKTANAESTIKGTLAHATTPPWVSGLGKTAPNIPNGPIPNISSGNISEEMQRTYNEIMSKTKTDKQYFTFRFGVNIRYWNINDNKLSWHSRKLGEIAFLRFMKSAVNSKTQFPALTNLVSFLVRRSVTIKGTTATNVKPVFRGTNG